MFSLTQMLKKSGDFEKAVKNAKTYGQLLATTAEVMKAVQNEGIDTTGRKSRLAKAKLAQIFFDESLKNMDLPLVQEAVKATKNLGGIRKKMEDALKAGWSTKKQKY